MAEQRPNDQNERRREGHKYFYDLFKHLTTLNTASILLMVTFLEKLFKEPQEKVFVGIAFASFVISLLGSVSSMYFYTRLLYESGRIEKWEGNVTGVSILMAIIGFLAGILSLIAFGVKNFF